MSRCGARGLGGCIATLSIVVRDQYVGQLASYGESDGLDQLGVFAHCALRPPSCAIDGVPPYRRRQTEDLLKTTTTLNSSAPSAIPTYRSYATCILPGEGARFFCTPILNGNLDQTRRHRASWTGTRPHPEHDPKKSSEHRCQDLLAENQVSGMLYLSHD